jgi:hypothetical protein
MVYVPADSVCMDPGSAFGEPQDDSGKAAEPYPSAIGSGANLTAPGRRSVSLTA